MAALLFNENSEFFIRKKENIKLTGLFLQCDIS
jgi:hypothetical protein